MKTITIIAAILFCFGCESSVNPSMPVNTVTAATKVVEVSKPKKEYENYKVGKWSGEGTKNTKTFHIPSNEWEIYWAVGPFRSNMGVFQIYIYRSDGTLVDVAANVTTKDKNNTTIRSGPGDYYLKINSANMAYGIVVAAFREVQ